MGLTSSPDCGARCDAAVPYPPELVPAAFPFDAPLIGALALGLTRPGNALTRASASLGRLTSRTHPRAPAPALGLTQPPIHESRRDCHDEANQSRRRPRRVESRRHGLLVRSPTPSHAEADRERSTSTPPRKQGGTVTISNEQGQTWPCQFNPFNPANNAESLGFVYEPLVYVDLLNNQAETPMLASGYTVERGQEVDRLHDPRRT